MKSKPVKFIEAESKMGLLGEGGEGNGGMLVRGTKLQLHRTISLWI